MLDECIKNLGVGTNQIACTDTHGLEPLNGILCAPFTDNRNLLPPKQVWDLVLKLFEGQERFRSVQAIRYVLRLRFGISGANRYSYNMRGQLRRIPEATGFFERIENDGFERYARYSRYSFTYGYCSLTRIY